MSDVDDIFIGYPNETRNFYRRLFFDLIMNLDAYQYGLFDTLLSDSDDKDDWARFYMAMTDIQMKLRLF